MGECRQILGSAQLSALHVSRDGASSNDGRLAVLSEQAQMSQPKLLITDKVCSLHMNHHIQGMVFTSCMEIARGLYTLAALTRWGVSWLTVIVAVPVVAASRLVVVRSAPPPECRDFASELIGYVALHCDVIAHRRRGPDGWAASSSDAKQRRRTNGDELLSILGPLLPGLVVLPRLGHARYHAASHARARSLRLAQSV